MYTYNHHILIFGSARSGTSWISESISRQRGYRLLFEPDQPHQVSKATLIADKYLNRNKSYHKTDTFLNRILRNQIDNEWIAQNSFRKLKMHLWPFLTKFIITKLIRSNLAIEYIATHYNIPIIKIFRNPEKVLHSQWRVKFPWLYDFSWFLTQQELLDIIYKRTNIDITKSYDEFEKLVLRWGIENALFPKLKHIKYYKYEDLKLDYSKVTEFMKEAGMKIPADLNYQLSKPSTKTHPKSYIYNRDQSSNDKLTDLQKNMMVDILKRFPYNPYSNN